MENSQNVFVPQPGAGGAVWSAPNTAKAPTDAVAKLGDEFHSLGLISKDGINNAEETNTQDIEAYGCKVVTTVQTSRKETVVFKPLETNVYVLAEQYGNDNVTVDRNGNIAVIHNAKAKPTRVYVIETILDSNKVQRDVIPLGRVTAVGERKLVDGEAIAREITVSCEQDAAGNTMYTYIAEIADDADNAEPGEETGEETSPEQGGE